jgi:hypothetical protein
MSEKRLAFVGVGSDQGKPFLAHRSISRGVGATFTDAEP